MKKRIIVTAFVAVLALSACSAGTGINVNIGGVRGSGTAAREERPVQGVRGVELATIGEMTIELGEQESLIIEADDNLLPYLQTEVRNGILTIGTERGANLMPVVPVRYTLTVPSLESLATSSAGDIVAPALDAGTFTARVSSSGGVRVDGVAAEQIRAEVSSNGSVNLGNIDTGRLDVDISSSGDVVVEGGQTGEQRITVSSSGEYQAGDLRSESAAVTLSSSGDATVWVSDTLDATLSSSGTLNYYGQPQVNQETSSSGRVVSLGEK